jgi:predicted nucleotidyltransferase
MHKEQLKILREFADKVRCIYPNARIWAFGSFARGVATAESDLDICVVLPQMEPDDRFAVSDMAWEVGFAHDLHLSTVVISESNFNQGPVSVSPLLEAVRSEGVAA